MTDSFLEESDSLLYSWAKQAKNLPASLHLYPLHDTHYQSYNRTLVIHTDTNNSNPAVWTSFYRFQLLLAAMLKRDFRGDFGSIKFILDADYDLRASIKTPPRYQWQIVHGRIQPSYNNESRAPGWKF